MTTYFIDDQLVSIIHKGYKMTTVFVANNTRINRQLSFTSQKQVQSKLNNCKSIAIVMNTCQMKRDSLLKDTYIAMHTRM